MKQTGFAFALLAIFLMSDYPAQAQKPAPRPALVTPAPDLSKLNIEKVLHRCRRQEFSRAPRKRRLCRLWLNFCNCGPAR